MRVRVCGGCTAALLALLLASVDASGQVASQWAADTTTGTIEIIVTSADTVRVTGAHVRIESPNRQEVLSDNEGFARIRDVAPGTNVLRILQIGYSPLRVSVDVLPGRTSRIIVQLTESTLWMGPSNEEVAKAAAEAATNGRVDSIARRLLSIDTTERLGWQTFGRDVLRSAMQRTRGDSTLVFSPMSAGMAFGMVLAGALGKTASELLSALGTGELKADEVGRRSARYLQNARTRTDVTLKIANAAWWKPALEESPEYRARVLRDYGATIERRILSSPEFVDALNAWAKEKTDGMIPKVIAKPLPDTAVFLLANATFFHGKWLLPFDSTKTRPRDFVRPTGSRRSVPMMERVSTVAYLVRPGYRVARLPYRGGKAAMYVVLPDSGVAINSASLPFIGRPTADSVAHAPMSQLRIVLPRFTGAHTENLLTTMQSLGVHALFECDAADLRDMLRTKGVPLCVGMASQTARIEVTEEGTKAAAITLSAGITATSAPPPPIDFIVNRPFFFVVRDEVYGVDLFVGYVATPDGR